MRKAIATFFRDIFKSGSPDASSVSTTGREHAGPSRLLGNETIDSLPEGFFHIQDPGWATERDEFWSANDEDYLYESVTDLLDAEDHLKPGHIVHVGEAIHPDPANYVDANDVIDMLAGRGYDDGGEFADGYPDGVSAEALDQLNRLLRAWLRTHCAPRFYRVIKTRPYQLTEADFADAVTSGKSA